VRGLTFQDQAVRLRRSWTEIRGWTGEGPAGLRPPEEAFDINTLRAWREAGGSYVLAVNQARSASPEIHRFGTGDPVVLLPRLMKDDYNVFVQEGAIRADRLSEAFLEGADKLRAIGGLAVVAVHTQIVGTGRRLEAIRAVAAAAKAQGDWWIAEAGEVAEWWRARDGLRLTAIEPHLFPDLPVQQADPDSTFAPTLVLRVEGLDEGLEGLWIDVVLPDGPDGRVPSVDGIPVDYTATEWGVRIPLTDLSPADVRTISFPPPNPPEINY
jgi:hypothetical protein